jgi:outer membrane protein TolC
MKQLNSIIALLFFMPAANAQQVITFSHPDSAIAYAAKNSAVVKNGTEQIFLAKYQTLYAGINRFNPRAAINYSATDNTKLPVNFIPGEVFGGPVGSFKQVQFGQQYIQAVNFTPQFDLVSPAAWAKWESAKTNHKLIAINNKIAIKNLQESVLSVFFNIVSFEHQQSITKQNLLNADSVWKIAVQKNQAGVLRIQDVNNTLVNKLLLQDRLSQLQFAAQQQYNTLKLLCDISVNDSVVVTYNPMEVLSISNTQNNLLVQQSQLQIKVAQKEYKANRFLNYPTLSLVGNLAWQENSNQQFFDKNANWIPASYIGIRLNIPIPDATKLSQTKMYKSNLHLAEINAGHQALQQEVQNRQLDIDYSKSIDNYQFAKLISLLKTDTYQKNFNLFTQDIYATDNLLVSFFDALTAQLNEQTAFINSLFQQYKIKLNNTIK